MEKVIYYALVAAASLISITLHECSHGYAAYKLGDPTAKDMGRLSLNPIKHIDIFGLISLIVLKIGWAKPVPVNPYYFKNRKSGMIIVSIAGPLSNLLLAVVSARLCVLLLKTTLYYPTLFLYIAAQLNVGLAVFNLMPLPPLDGSKILASLLPPKWEEYFYRYQSYLSLIVLALYFFGLLDVVIYPVIDFICDIIFA